MLRWIFPVSHSSETSNTLTIMRLSCSTTRRSCWSCPKNIACCCGRSSPVPTAPGEKLPVPLRHSWRLLGEKYSIALNIPMSGRNEDIHSLFLHPVAYCFLPLRSRTQKRRGFIEADPVPFRVRSRLRAGAILPVYMLPGNPAPTGQKLLRRPATTQQFLPFQAVLSHESLCYPRFSLVAWPLLNTAS